MDSTYSPPCCAQLWLASKSRIRCFDQASRVHVHRREQRQQMGLQRQTDLRDQKPRFQPDQI
jgi:hypothetical protein